MMLGRVSNVQDRSHRYAARNRPKKFKEDDYECDDASSSNRSTGRDAAQNSIV